MVIFNSFLYVYHRVAIYIGWNIPKDTRLGQVWKIPIFFRDSFSKREASLKNRLIYPQIIQVVLENVPLPSGSQSGLLENPPFQYYDFPMKKKPP